MRTLVIAMLTVVTLTGCGSDPKKMVERRKASRAKFLDSLLTEAQRRLQITDSTLQAEEAAYNEMAKATEQHRKDLTATKEELEALNKKRIRIDSLKTIFEVDCGRVKYIHKKQRSLEPER